MTAEEKLEELLGVTNDVQRQAIKRYLSCAQTCGCYCCSANRRGAGDGIDPAKAAEVGVQVAQVLAEAIS